ncbi:SMI1/KNR4 family protein [Kordia sp.]|uniref:SMI1/KNR4 family protein n=1 Tax=Kordia sp. TaxID=1965332 RepID=UPI003B5923E8
MIKYKSKAQNITLEEFQQLENNYSIKLPQDYKNHMLKCNGINPLEDYYFLPDIWEDEINFFYILPIKYGSYIFEEGNLIGYLEDYPEMQVMIGVTRTGSLSMSLKKEEHGSIYVYYSDGEMHKLANSFTEFLEGLEICEDF